MTSPWASTEPQRGAGAPTEPQPGSSAPTEPQPGSSAPTEPQPGSSAPTEPRPSASPQPGDAVQPGDTLKPGDAVQPGETRPARLARPPSARFAAPEAPPREEADHLRSLLAGAGAGLVVAVTLALLASILDLRAGLLVVSALGGWAIGAAVRWGAWGGDPHRPSARGGLVAAVLGTFTWLAGLVLAWVVAMAILPGSARPFVDRLTGTPLLDWLGPQFDLLEVASLFLIVSAAWLAGRDRAAPSSEGR